MERKHLAHFLRLQREAVAASLDGLSSEDARRRPCEGSNSLIELVNHLAWVERWWFDCVFSGEPDPWPDEDPDIDFKVPDDQTVAETLELYRTACARSDEVLAAGDLDAEVPLRDGKVTLRWIAFHMLEETARHAGHADITRQLIDGRCAT